MGRTAVGVPVRRTIRMDVSRRAVIVCGGDTMVVGEAVKRDRAVNEGERYRRREDAQGIGRGDDDRRPDPKCFLQA